MDKLYEPKVLVAVPSGKVITKLVPVEVGPVLYRGRFTLTQQRPLPNGQMDVQQIPVEFEIPCAANDQEALDGFDVAMQKTLEKIKAQAQEQSKKIVLPLGNIPPHNGRLTGK